LSVQGLGRLTEAHEVDEVRIAALTNEPSGHEGGSRAYLTYLSHSKQAAGRGDVIGQCLLVLPWHVQ
jgi:hypothetical protein